MSQKVAIIGGGLAGLTTARLLEPYCDEITVVEKEKNIGGLCRTQNIDGIPIDLTGGHVVNSKNNAVKEFIFSIFPTQFWKKTERNAKIYIDGKIIGFPFEFNMFELREEFLNKCLYEIRRRWHYVNNLHDYFLSNYGPTACEKYYFPYNEKIWEYPLDKIGTKWISGDKIPVNTYETIKEKNQGGGVDTGMTHSSFYYPRHGGIYGFVSRIPSGKSTILTDAQITEIKKQGKKWHVKWINNCFPTMGDFTIECDIIINTAGINKLLQLLRQEGSLNTPSHGTSFYVCESDFYLKNPYVTWTYFPEAEYPFHRVCNMSLISGMEHNLVIVEAPFKNRDLRKIEIPGYKFRILHQYSHCHSKTYPIEPVENLMDIEHTVEELKRENIYSLGRWATHKYLNMDKVIEQAIRVKEEIING